VEAMRVRLPMDAEVARTLQAGQAVLLSGPIYALRDAAHARLDTLIREGRGAELPIALDGAGIYYVGPAPAGAGHIVGSAGPTTSERMDAYTPALIERGLRLMVGKGRRGADVKAAMQRHGAVYLAATGGAGALLARQIVKSDVIAYPELGAEAIHQMELRDFPCVVVIDTTGEDLYETGPRAYEVKR
jgi:fumarate hydratase subunit beta